MLSKRVMSGSIQGATELTGWVTCGTDATPLLVCGRLGDNDQHLVLCHRYFKIMALQHKVQRLRPISFITWPTSVILLTFSGTPTSSLLPWSSLTVLQILCTYYFFFPKCPSLSCLSRVCLTLYSSVLLKQICETILMPSKSPTQIWWPSLCPCTLPSAFAQDTVCTAESRTNSMRQNVCHWMTPSLVNCLYIVSLKTMAMS